MLAFADGLIAELTVSVLLANANNLEMYRERGVLTAQHIFRHAAEPSLITLNGDAVTYDPNDAFADEVADFVRAIQTARAPTAGVDDGMRNVEIMEQARVGTPCRTS